MFEFLQHFHLYDLGKTVITYLATFFPIRDLFSNPDLFWNFISLYDCSTQAGVHGGFGRSGLTCPL